MPFLKKFPTSSAGSDSGSGSNSTWLNPNNMFATDGVMTSSGFWVAGKGTSGLLKASGFGYSLPPGAIIDGIQVDVIGGTFNRISSVDVFVGNGAKTGYKNFSGTLSPMTLGGPTDLWGRTDWLYSDIASSAFFASLQYNLTSSPADALANVDSIAVTVYYHLSGTTSPSDVPIREYYKVYNQQGQFLGLMPQPTEPLKIAQDINSLGSQITIKVPVSADTSAQANENYITEDASDTYTTEDGLQNYTTEGAVPIVSAAFQGIDTLIKNGNTVEQWLVNYWYPNGKRMFVGKIRRWEADFGGDSGNNDVSVVLYSSGYDLDNYITRGAPFSYTADNTQTNYNLVDTILQNGDKGGGWHLDGQSFKVGAGVTNLGAISVALYGTATVTINVYDAPGGGNLLASIRQYVSVGTPTGILFGFPNLIPTTPGQTLFFTVTPDPGQSIGLCYNNANPYANGSMYTSDYSGGSGGGNWILSTNNDLWFTTSSGTPSTAATFTSKDPTTGMIAPIISDYNLRGGSQIWTAASIDATGLSLTYRFNVQTIYEAMDAVLSLCPNGFYYYVDLGAQTIYFKNASTVADFTFIKGVHINSLKLITTTENSMNQLLFTGGDGGTGINLYRQYADNRSIQALGPLLERKTDSRVTLAPTADAIGNSAIAEQAGEQYQTTVTIAHTKRLDITLLVPGKVVGFRGLGTFADLILAQIVHREWTANAVVLTLGVLPKRLSVEYETTTRSLIASQTMDNPATPS